MKILSSEQIRKIDCFTIENKPISSTDLMENAAEALCKALIAQYDNSEFHIFCGKGNNGGDGLALARLLLEKRTKVEVYLPEWYQDFSEDNLINQGRLNGLIQVNRIREDFIPDIHPCGIIIDALYGSGLTRETEGADADLIKKINALPNITVAVDIPSGLFADRNNTGENIIKSDHTFAFEIPKTAFFLPQNHRFIGEWHLLNIGLLKEAINREKTTLYFIDKDEFKGMYKPREKFSHKGTFGHSLIIAGSYGKIGAAVLSAEAALRSGSGLVTAFIPKCGYDIMQTSVPEVMCITDNSVDIITETTDLSPYNAMGIGPGIGKDPKTSNSLYKFLTSDLLGKNLVLDADALNILAENPDFLHFLPPNTILTPHPKEFERLAGKWQNDYHRLELQQEFAKKHAVILIVKGAHTSIALPDGRVYFNSTGNPGMATAGSGDVLTGILTGLLAQGYSPEEAAVFAVYLHGLSGDLAVEITGHESLTASDLINILGKAFLEISNY